MMIDKYLQAQSVVIDAFALFGEDVYAHIVELNVFLLIYDEEKKVIGFWPVYDRPHVFHVEKIEELGDFVTVYHSYGKLELSPPLPEQASGIEEWRRRVDVSRMRETLQELMDEVAREPVFSPPKPRRKYKTAIEEEYFDGQWRIVGAWAANKRGIAFVAPEGYSEHETRRNLQIAQATAKPMELFNYVIESASGYSTVTPFQEVKANSAKMAAYMALHLARQKAGIEKS